MNCLNCIQPCTICFEATRDSTLFSKSGRGMDLRLLFRNDLAQRVRPWKNDQDLFFCWMRKPCFGVIISPGMRSVVLASCLINGRVSTKLVLSSVSVGS